MNTQDVQIVLNPEKMAYWTVITVGLMTTLVIGRDLLIPLTLSIFLSVLLNSLRTAILNIRLFKGLISKPFAMLLSLIAVLLVNIPIVTILSNQAELFQEYVPIYEQNLQQLVFHIQSQMGIHDFTNTEVLLTNINLAGILSWFGESISIVFSNLFLVLMFSMFLLAEENVLPVKLARLTGDPEKARYTKTICQNISTSIQKYILIKTIVSGLTGFLSFLVLEFAGVHFAPMWGVIIFFFNYIPNIGSLFGVLLPSLLCLLQFEALQPFLIVGCSLTLVQFVIGNIVEPAYLGKQLNLSPFVVLVSLAFWGAIWGLVGMFVSIPMMVMTSLVCQHIQGLQWISRLLSTDGEYMKI